MTLEICIYTASIISWVAFNWIAGNHETKAEQAIARGKLIMLGGIGLSLAFAFVAAMKFLSL